VKDIVLKVLQNSIKLSNEIGEKSDFYIHEINETKDKLKSILDNDKMKRVEDLIRYIEYHILDTRDSECVESFYLGLKLGQDMSEVLKNIENNNVD